MITLKDIIEAKNRLDGVVYNTPLAFAPTLSKELNANIYLKKKIYNSLEALKLEVPLIKFHY